MISVSVEADISKAVQFLNLLQKEADSAASMAINKLATTAKGQAARIIADRTKLPLNKVRKRITIRGASRRRLIAVVTGNSYSPNMGNYGASQGTYGTGASVPPGRPVFVGHAFVMNRKGRPVMIRAKRGSGRVGRKPLESVRVEVLKRTWVQSTVDTVLRDTIARRWPIEFDRALRVELSKLRGPSVFKAPGPILPNLTAPTIE